MRERKEKFQSKVGRGSIFGREFSFSIGRIESDTLICGGTSFPFESETSCLAFYVGLRAEFDEYQKTNTWVHGVNPREHV